MAIAENDLVLNGAKENRDFEEFHKTKSGSLARTTKTSLDQQQSVTQVGTQVSGKEVVLSAGHDMKAKGIQAIADNNLHIQGGHDVDIAADTNHFKNKRVETKKTRGVFTDGGIGFTVGSKSEKHDYETEGWTQSDARSTLGSMNGNIRVSAGNHTNVLGTDMITPRTNQIDIEGASVKVEAGKDIIERKEGHEYKQSGVTIALSTPVTDMAQAAYNSVNRSQQVTNGKLKALYAVKAAEEATMAAQNVGKVAETLDALRAGNMQNTGTTSSPSMKISLGYGSQKQTQSSESQSISHQKSTVSTGTFNVKARDEKLTFEGVDANAKLMALSGKKGIEIKGVKDEEHQHTKNKSAGGSVGVFVGTNGNSYGVGIEGSVNAAKGKSNSDSERWQNSHLQADKLITNSEAGNLSLDAANLNAKRWEADIQNLTITSRQDTEKYESKQTSASASGSVAQGSGGSASVSASYNKAKVDYAQVNEQAGIRVGEDGMDAHIHNHTQLNGAIIESDADASKNRFKTKSLTHTDIENRSEIEVKSVSAGLSTDMAQNAKNAMATAASALGNKHESATSQTQSAIGSNIQIDTETPENLTALSRDTQNANHKVKAFDLQEIKEQQEAAQVAGELFAKVTGDLAKKLGFEDGSKEKIAMHALAGALAAKMSGGNVATGAVAGAGSEWLNTYVTDYLNEQAKDLKLDAEQKEKLKQAAQQMTALVIGAAAGAVTGGTSETIKQGALASYNAETYNRQLHQNEKERIKLLANGDEEKERRLEIAACALVHCSAQIPTDDPDYAKLYEQARALEQLGNTAEYAQERALLKRQTETFSDPFGSGVQNKLFEYNDTYKALDYANRIDTKYAVTTRAGGVVQAVGGVAAMAVGTGLCETGIGCVAGVPVAAYGADNTYTGGRVILTGKNQNTLGGQLLSQVTGLSPETANFVYSLPSLYTGAKPILGATARLGNQVVSEGSQMASAMGYVAGELGKDVVSGYRVVRDTAIKTSVNTQLAYTDLVGKSVNGAREYVRTGVKNMGEQGTKVALTNAVAAGGIKAGFEANDYANGKSLTRDNLLKSTKEVGYSFFSAGATTGMPILPVIGLGVTVDWAKDSGNYDIVKTTGSNILSSGLENKFGHYTGFPLIKEAMTNSFEKYYEQLKEANKHEK